MENVFWDTALKAYVSSDAGTMNQLRAVDDGAIKIPYRIFVGGIAFNTTKEELKDFFSNYGAVRDTKIIKDSEGLSKGYGFVTFYREEDAQKVMNMGTIFFKEKRLNISEAFRKPQLVNQQAAMDLVTVPVAAPTTWTSPSSTAPVYYTAMNQQAPQLPQLQLSSSRTWPVVQGIPMPQQPAAEIVWVPQYYYY